MRWPAILLLFCIGVAASFAVVVNLIPGGIRGAPTARAIDYDRIEHDERFDDPSILSNALTSGWGKQEAWGVWMGGREAAIVLETSARARADIQMILEGRGPPAGRPARLLQVLVNDSPVGEIELQPGRGEIARRLVVAQAVFDRRWPPTITVRLDDARPEGFGIRRVSLRDASQIRIARGFVDGCESGKVYGWATADDIAVPVIVTANGERLTGRMNVIERPDLAQLRLPRDAGFELVFPKPLPNGTEVHVSFPGGRPLDQSPCRI